MLYQVGGSLTTDAPSYISTVKLWRTDGSAIATLQGHQAAVFDVNFSADGQYIVSSSMDGTIKIWNSKLLLMNLSRNS